MIIETRQKSNGDWWCNGTIYGYDVSFESKTSFDARRQMIVYLKGKGINIEDVKWMKPQTYSMIEKKVIPKIEFVKK